MIYLIFLATTFAGALIINSWLLLCYLTYNILNELGGWPLILSVSWALAIAIFFQGTRIREWLDAI